MVDSTIPLTNALKDRLATYEDIFRILTGGADFPGAHPVIINGEMRGIRLGQDEPKTGQKSLCVIAGTHPNEPAGWETEKEVLGWWKGLSTPDKAALPGDIYLMFGGEKTQMKNCFHHLASADEISVENLTRYRATGNGINRNRVPKHPLGPEPEAEEYKAVYRETEMLQSDYKALEEKVFAHCGLVLDIHSLSQAGEGMALPHFSDWPDHSHPAYTIQQDAARERVAKLASAMGARYILPDSSSHVPTHDLAGFSTPSSLRLLYECGGPHLAEATLDRGKWAAQAALHHLFPEQAQATDHHSAHLTIHGKPQYLFMPGQANASFSAPGFLPQGFSGDETDWGRTLHLITGKDGETLPSSVLKALGEDYHRITHDQLANGSTLLPGQPVGWIEKGDQTVILRMPPGDRPYTVFMAPRTGNHTDSSYVLMFTSDKQEIDVSRIVAEPASFSERYHSAARVAGRERAGL